MGNYENHSMSTKGFYDVVKQNWYLKLSVILTNLENMESLENSGNLKNCQNLKENSGKFELFVEKPGKLRENVKYVA